MPGRNPSIFGAQASATSATVLAMRPVLALALTAAVCLTTGEAAASPHEDTTLGGSVFTGPLSPHASSFFVNPAALGLSARGIHLHLGASSRLDSLWIRRREVDPQSLQLHAGEGYSDHTLSPGGLFAAYGSFRGTDARFGVALYTPNLRRFPKGNSAMQYYSEGGYIAQGMLTLAGSYEFGGKLLVGLGVSLGYTSARLTFARDTALEGGSDSEDGITSDCGGSPCGFENPMAAEHYHIAVGNQPSIEDIAVKNLSASIGLAYRLRRDTWLALSYIGLPGAFSTLKVSGTATVERAEREGGGTYEGIAELGIRMPQIVFLGYKMHAFGDYDFLANFRWSDLSRHDQFDVRMFGGDLPDNVPEWYPRYRGLHDTFRLGVGLESRALDEFRTGARLRVESSGLLDDRTNPIQVEPWNATGGLGAEFRFFESLVLSASYDLTWYPVVDVENSAFNPVDRLECVDSQYNFDLCAATRDGRALPTAAGRYRRIRHAMMLSIGYESL
jgi:long-subunit fatty acid transport protein